MKRLKLLTITLFIFLFGINNVNAMTLKPSGAASGKRGDEVTLYVTLEKSTSEKNISAVDGILSYDSNVLELVSSSNLMTGWTQFAGISNGSSFGYGNLSFDNLITSTKQNLVKVVFKINSNASYGNTTVTISNPSATDEVGDSVSVAGGSHNVKVLSDVNTLSNIIISNSIINFSENSTTYNLEIDSASTEISVSKKDSNSVVTGDVGTKTLKYGLNTFKITVTSESGKSMVYTLNITRPDNRSNVNTLSSLKLSEGNIKFNKDTTSYNVTVKSDVDKIKVDATLTDDKSNFVSGYGPRMVDLKVGKNIIEVRVKAENESVKIYKINVTREDDRSNNNYLSGLTLSSGTISFDKEILEYETTVLYEVEKIDLEIETEDSKATYEVSGNKELVVGENIVTIKVTAENESTKEYKIKVIRKEESETLSNNSNLTSLIIEGYQISFSKSQYEYSLKINDETTLNIKYELEDAGSVVTIHGNENLENGSLVRVKVTAEDGSETEYKIRIEKEENSMLMYIIIGGVILLIIVIIVIIILTKKRNKPSNELFDSNSINNINDIPVNQNIQNMQYQAYQNSIGIQNSQNMNGIQSPQQNVQNISGIQNNQNMVNSQSDDYRGYGE